MISCGLYVAIVWACNWHCMLEIIAYYASLMLDAFLIPIMLKIMLAYSQCKPIVIVSWLYSFICSGS